MGIGLGNFAEQTIKGARKTKAKKRFGSDSRVAGTMDGAFSLQKK
jgi:hypothetical protein